MTRVMRRPARSAALTDQKPTVALKPATFVRYVAR